MAGPSLGTNLSGLTDWSTAFPFVDLFRLSRGWYTQREGVFDTGEAGLLDLDDAGWLRGFTRDGTEAPFERVSTILFTGGHVPAGVYVLDWEGAGEIALGLVPDDAILSRTDGRIEVRLEAGQMLEISILATDPAGSGDYIRDMRLYNRQDADLLAAGRQFTPEFLERIGDFRSLRFMDWMGTNNSAIRDWRDRPEGDDARETLNGASVETMVALANEVRADPWFTLPHLASDAYIRAFATYVRDHLAEGLVARFEFSNEVWNWGFDQAQHAQRQAERLWGAGVEGGWMQWYGMRAARMAEIVAEVFGEATGTRALNVFSTQSGWQGLESYALDAPDRVAAGGTAPRDAPFHVYAIAPYFGGSIGATEMADRVDDWIAMGEAGFRAAIAYLRGGEAADTLARIGETIAYHAAVAEGLGWQLEAYEGGQHIVDLDGLFGGAQDPAQTAFFVDLVKRPAFRQLYQEYFEIWRENGGGLMAQFSDFGAGDRYGSWGIWDSLYAPDSPRARAVEAFRDHVAAWWSDARPASVFANGVTRVDRDGADRLHGGAQDDMLVGLGGDNRLDGRGGDDVLTAGGGRDLLIGGGGADALSGRGGADSLRGGAGADLLRGGAGADLLTGGSGADLLSGGAGADVFLFGTRQHSRPGAPDTITDFRRGVDKLDLHPLAGETAPAWRGGREFTAAGRAEWRYAAPEGETPLLLQFDADGDGRADMAIRLAGLARLGLDDLIL